MILLDDGLLEFKITAKKGKILEAKSTCWVGY